MKKIFLLLIIMSSILIGYGQLDTVNIEFELVYDTQKIDLSDSDFESNNSDSLTISMLKLFGSSSQTTKKIIINR